MKKQRPHLFWKFVTYPKEQIMNKTVALLIGVCCLFVLFVFLTYSEDGKASSNTLQMTGRR